ncbi:hypothetical protein, partial [Marinobacter alexandrii]|uniref:hypothetical protein n=1 Tax=Marinobacter alexandrii TaxID=2570351 RepID=UPI003297EAA8
MIQRWANQSSFDPGTTTDRPAPGQADTVTAARALDAADTHPDVLAAEQALATAEALGAASATTASRRGQTRVSAELAAAAATRVSMAIAVVAVET